MGDSFHAYAVSGLPVQTPGERDETECQLSASMQRFYLLGLAHPIHLKLANGQPPATNALQASPAWIKFQSR